ncbi:Ankyrin repeat-containing protein itn1 [Dionaea muscipula]
MGTEVAAPPPSPISCAATLRPILTSVRRDSTKKLALTNSSKKLLFDEAGKSLSMSNIAKFERDLEMGGDLAVADISPPSSPLTPTVIMYNSGKALAVTNSTKQLASPYSGKSLLVSGSGKSLGLSNSGKSLVLYSGSGKRMDQKKMYVKQVTGKHNDTELHLVAQRGDLEAVRQILTEIDSQMTGTPIGAEFDAELAEIRTAIVNEVNELGETALFTAAEKGHLEVVRELLPYMTNEGIATKNRSGFDALHIAARQGHPDIVEVLLNHCPELSKTVGQSNATPLISAATLGHVAVVKELLSKDSSLLEMTKTNGKNALHMASRQGHADIVKALLAKDPQLARRTDKKGQTALHMAAKGQSSKVVRLLLQADPAIVMLPDRYGNTALHIATRKKRAEIVAELLLRPNMNVNALTRDGKTALDIADGCLPLSEEIVDIKESLIQYGAVKANELNQPRDELRKTVTEIQKNVQSQLEQARKTNKNVTGIAKELKKLHREGINNATNSVTVVAVLFATVAFAAIFTVPGGDDNTGMAVMAKTTSFRIFFIFNAVALFTSLAVVVVQITVVRGETKSERRVVEVINKLMWLAAVCTTVAFSSSSYIVVGRHYRWAAFFVTFVGAVVMVGVLGTMTFYVVKYKRIRKVRKKEKEKSSRNGLRSIHETDFSDTEFNPIYAI